MIYTAGRFRITKIVIMLVFSLLLVCLVSVGSLRAQIKKEDVNFEVLATVTMKTGDALWNLAQEYYKEPLQWKYIAEMNKIKDERKIPTGTVVYIPVKDAKIIEQKVEQEIVTTRAVVDETALKIAEMQKEIDRLKKEHEDCIAKRKELEAALKDKDDMIAALQDKIKALTNELAAKSELEARLEDMQVAARSTSERKDELSGALREKDAAIAEREARIAEMEWKYKQAETEMTKLESMRDELRSRIKKSEETQQVTKIEVRKEEAKPIAKVKRSDPGARVAAVALALVGSIIWMASDK